MLIMCSSANNATRLYEYLLDEIKEKPSYTHVNTLILPNNLSELIVKMNTFFFNFVPSTPSWSFLGCSRY